MGIIVSFVNFKKEFVQGGNQKKLPRRPNDLPHHPLVLCSNIPNDHGHFDEV